MNLSFAGCGFLGIYHVGVAVCFKKYAPHLLEQISGASVGALAATCLLCDMPLGEMTSDFFRIVNEARKHSLGPFSPSFNIQTCLLEGLQKFLPANAHELVNGRLNVSLTRVFDGKNIMVSQFNSREELLQVLLCACFIPGFSGIVPPKFRGTRYMDGAFSNNLPIIDDNTITVSPFCGESDICPRDRTAQLYHLHLANTSVELSRPNINRFCRILFPPKPEDLSKMCQNGFDDALNFLHKNDLLSCTRCLAVQSTFALKDSLQDSEDYDPECKECIKHRKNALIDDMPETVLTVFQTYIESANKGLASWIFRHRGVKLLKTLSLPATLPADFVCATLTKLLLMTNNVTSYVGDTVDRRQFRFMVLANIVKSSIPKLSFREELAADNSRRISAATPCIKEQLHNITKYVWNQFDLMVSSKKQPKMAANISYELSLAECDVPKPNHLTRRSSKVQILINDNKISTKIENLATSNDILGNGVDFDTFDHILEVTNEHEAVYAFYYMDEHRKVKIRQIFDMTNSDSPDVQSPQERETNDQLQFDDEWDAPQSGFPYGDGEHCKQSTITDLAENDLFNNTINETLLEIEELESDSSDLSLP